MLAVGVDCGKNMTKRGDVIKVGRGGRAEEGRGEERRGWEGGGGRPATVKQVPQGECVVCVIF